jgi:hypothetical protein
VTTKLSIKKVLSQINHEDQKSFEEIENHPPLEANSEENQQLLLLHQKL